MKPDSMQPHNIRREQFFFHWSATRYGFSEMIKSGTLDLDFMEAVQNFRGSEDKNKWLGMFKLYSGMPHLMGKFLLEKRTHSSIRINSISGQYLLGYKVFKQLLQTLWCNFQGSFPKFIKAVGLNYIFTKM